MSFKSVIKKSILNSFERSALTTQEIIVLLVLAAIIGIYIYFVYRYICKRNFYSKSFNVSLILMTIITATVIITIQSSIVVSLGMVGALSIVRFRTAIKEPIDLIFAFWSLCSGIVIGAQLPVLAYVMAAVVTIVLLVFFSFANGKTVYLLQVSGSMDYKAVSETVKNFDPKFVEKSINETTTQRNVLYQVVVKDKEEFMAELRKIEGVKNISLVAHKDDIF